MMMVLLESFWMLVTLIIVVLNTDTCNGINSNNIQGDSVKETLILMGEPKSGTTWLELVLKGLTQHACAEPHATCTYEYNPLRRTFTLNSSIPDDGGGKFLSRDQHRSTKVLLNNLKHRIYPDCVHIAHPNGFANDGPHFLLKHGSSEHCNAELPTLASTDQEIQNARVRIRECVAQAYTNHCLPNTFEPETATSANVDDVNINTRAILALRDPREVAISEYFFFHSHKSMEDYITKRLPIVTSWISVRYELTKLVNLHSRPDSGLPAATVVMYNEMIHSGIPYLKLCQALGIPCNYSMVSEVKNQLSADKMRTMEKGSQLPGFNGKGSVAKVRSAGNRSIADYGFSKEFLYKMQRYTELMLPEELSSHMRSLGV